MDNIPFRKGNLCLWIYPFGKKDRPSELRTTRAKELQCQSRIHYKMMSLQLYSIIKVMSCSFLQIWIRDPWNNGGESRKGQGKYQDTAVANDTCNTV
jgi:hypothetical protein